MIKVVASHDGTGEPLAELHIEWIEQVDERLHRYSLRIACEGIGEVQLRQRNFLFPRLEGNTLALMLAALSILEEQDLRLPDGTSASDLARRFRGSWPALPR
jgi:hypothetical protein